jgi:hypothetical protein
LLEPRKINSLDELHPLFRARLERWLEQTRATFPQFIFRTSETRRTLERQKWLHGSGRPDVKPYGRPGPILTYTLMSRHRYGLAADLVVVRKVTPWRAEWDGRLWRGIYEAVPPAQYKLKHLDFEFVHLEAEDADEIIKSGTARLT